MRASVMAVLAVAALAVGAQAQDPSPREPTLPRTTVGSELFRLYCATCHGQDAKGRPATAAMRVPAPDLTTLALNHGGVFPRDDVRQIIEHGQGTGSSHLSGGMPVWGTIFRAFEPSDTMVAVRIENLVSYIESLQTNAVKTNVERRGELELWTAH
jgi:mono/diheme cytochrome c family protein